MDDLAVERRPPNHGAAVSRDWVRPQEALEFGRKAVIRRHPVDRALATGDQSHLGLTQPRCGLAQSIQHRLQVEGRAADDFEYVAYGGLVFERFPGFA